MTRWTTLTVRFWVQKLHHPKVLFGVNRYEKCFDLMCISRKVNEPLLRYGTPDTLYLTKNYFFGQIPHSWLKLWRKMMFLFFCPLLIHYNAKILWEAWKNSKKSKPVKYWQKSFLMVEMHCFCNLRTLSPHFHHFSKYIKNCNFGSKF